MQKCSKKTMKIRSSLTESGSIKQKDLITHCYRLFRVDL